MKSCFHLAFHVHDLAQARHFYGTVLGCMEGRSTASWVDFDFFGHQISLHLGTPSPHGATARVGEHLVPIPHMGVILPMPEWEVVAAHVRNHVTFLIEPCIRFAGQAGEQATMFFLDPSGNALEIKGFADCAEIFAQ